MSRTIAAIATATGVGSISIVRVSGEDALKISSKLLKGANLTPRVAKLHSIYNKENSLIDRGIIIYFKAPNSFTGEDIVEFQCHGGIVIAQEILDTLLHFGASLAKPGEFTQRAFLNGKIDLSEAEAIAKMIETKSVDGAKVIARQLKGELREFVEKSRDRLINLLAYSEVMIDYAEEDIDEDILTKIESNLEELKDRLQHLLKASLQRKGVIEGFLLAIIGKPNVGKSSILNKMLNYERAIVSDIAGTTRDTIEEQIRIGSHIVRIADTAGIREATDIIEKMGVERSIKWLNEADIIVAVFDASSPLDKEDLKILEHLKDIPPQKVIIALNKIDKGIKIDKDRFKNFKIVEISAKTSVDRLIEEIETILKTISQTDELLLISTRQIESVKRALKEIELAFEPLKNLELEFFSYHLNEAIKAFEEITRPYQHQELLDKMFSEFCLGK
ncbi:MAG: tRNA uridine-5-carboxymethylaminomethyl(34) synthesis GTPase MnmE [Epsilonproteobacteria bacterium]|nr:tRNA uridine-5-carboxymethylaminomethyl(34) synthesis GTPase MnmE [Campylobacterota bacterium]